MLKKLKINKWIILIVLVVLVVVIGVCKMFGNTVNIRGQHLNEYSCSIGGGMTGGYRMETVKKYNDQALIRIESAEWHSQDPEVTEYLTDAAVLDELEEIARKHKMNTWNKKKFTDMFIADGESESYRFSFDDEDIYFSSQIYPKEYREKLAELDAVVKKYIEAGEKL